MGANMMLGMRRCAPLARLAALAVMLALGACSSTGTRTVDGSMAEQLNRCRAEAEPIYQAAGFGDYIQRVRTAAQRCGIGSRGLAALGAVEQRAILDIDRFPAGLYPQMAAL